MELTRDTVAVVISRRYVRGAVDEGLQPGQVADLVVESIATGRYWVLPSPEFLDLAVERFHRIAEQADPVAPEHVPGMPPRSRIMAEVLAAMAAPTEGE